MDNKLVSLEEFNKRARESYGVSRNQSRPNGIACPECGEELWDKNRLECLTSWPPRRDVYCITCGYHGNRVC